jgi:Leucine-rich repeat (LRR) protein
LERVNGLNSEYLPNLKELNIKGNNFTEFPQIELKKLLWLDISSNKIDSSGNAASWRLPKVRKINCSSNLLKGFPNIHFPELLDFECNNNLIEKFIGFENCKKV